MEENTDNNRLVRTSQAPSNHGSKTMDLENGANSTGGEKRKKRGPYKKRPRVPKKKEKRFKCDQCEYASKESSNLVVHKRVHTGEKPFKCDQCNYASARPQHLKLHRFTHTDEKPFKCDQCEHTFASNSTLAAHGRVHMAKKPFQCDQCDYATAQPSYLIIHQRRHTGERPFRCDQCEYATTSKGELKQHRITHTGEKPLKCDQCNYASARPQHLKRHLLLHTGDTPFRCGTGSCNFAVKEAKYLEFHRLTHVDRRILGNSVMASEKRVDSDVPMDNVIKHKRVAFKQEPQDMEELLVDDVPQHYPCPSFKTEANSFDTPVTVDNVFGATGGITIKKELEDTEDIPQQFRFRCGTGSCNFAAKEVRYLELHRLTHVDRSILGNSVLASERRVDSDVPMDNAIKHKQIAFKQEPQDTEELLVDDVPQRYPCPSFKTEAGSFDTPVIVDNVFGATGGITIKKELDDTEDIPLQFRFSIKEEMNLKYSDLSVKFEKVKSEIQVAKIEPKNVYIRLQHSVNIKEENDLESFDLPVKVEQVQSSAASQNNTQS